jgi:hypothetical protein
MLVAFEEGLLPTREGDLVDRLAGERQPQREQDAGHQRAPQPDRDLTEVDLGLHPGPVTLRREHLGRAVAGLGTDLGFAGRAVGADHLV